MDNNDKGLDQGLVNAMFSIIRVEEANNLKTGKLNDTQMVNRIAQIINMVLKEESHEI